MDWDLILSELVFRTSRSSGAGGQHVNKTETKVEVLFNVEESSGLSAEEKTLVIEKLGNRISGKGELSLSAQKSRSQLDNKERVVERLNQLLTKAITPAKNRVRTKVPKAVIEERLTEKKRKGELKVERRKPDVL